MEKYEELMEILLEIRDCVEDALNVVAPPPPNTLAKAPQEGRSEEQPRRAKRLTAKNQRQTYTSR